MSNLRHRVLIICLVAIISLAAILACGPDFPNMLLNQGDRAVLVAPTATFRREIERLKLAKSPYRYQPSPQDRDGSAEAEISDLRAALRKMGKSEEEGNELIARHSIERVKLSNPEQPIEIVDGLPAEFADYFRGAIAWHRADGGAFQATPAGQEERRKLYREACVHWQRLLDRPAADRTFKSTWAAFMLGETERFAQNGNREISIARFQLVRSLVNQGFADSFGLAAFSLGEEAQIYLGNENYIRSIELYLEQATTGTPSAIDSLRMVSAQVCRPEQRDKLKEVAAHPAARRVITAWLISRGPRTQNTDFEQITDQWLDFLESENVLDLELAEELALAAYKAGRMVLARRWLERSSSESFATRWLSAKLLLYEGKLADAATVLSNLAHDFPVADEKDLFASSLTVESDHVQLDVPSREQALGELGVLHLARREFTQALDALLRSGFWIDAAYIAERVLTLPELCAYVDTHWPPAANEVPLVQEPEVWIRNTDPDVLRFQIRYLLARRLARSQQEDKSRQYFPLQWRKHFDEFSKLKTDSQDKNKAARDRARDLFAAATILREYGLELIGTETAPDWHVYGGSFTEGFTAETRAGIGEPNQIVASQEELTRAGDQKPEPDRRYHYRYVAAQTAFEASKLLPDNDDETARILCTAGSWIKKIDPKGADLFYKTLVRRCRKTDIGKEADRIRWFPQIDEKGNIIPQLPKPPAARPQENMELQVPLALLGRCLGFMMTPKVAAMC